MRWFIERCTPEPDIEYVRRWGHHMLMRAEPEAAERLWRIGQPPSQEVVDGVTTIRVPTLLIHGEKDVFVSLEAMQHLASRIPGAKLAVIPGAGHLPAMIQPDRMAALINEHFADYPG